MSHEIDVQIEAPFDERVAVEDLRRCALAVLIHQEVNDTCDLAVVVSDDNTLHDLNLRYREVDKSTDVLAFPNESRGPFAGAPGMPRYLGDVVISFPRAEAQAQQAGHTVVAELQLLVVHGVLHLLGYDDTEPQHRARMWAVQAKILDLLGVDAHPPQ